MTPYGCLSVGCYLLCLPTVRSANRRGSLRLTPGLLLPTTRPTKRSLETIVSLLHQHFVLESHPDILSFQSVVPIASSAPISCALYNICLGIVLPVTSAYSPLLLAGCQFVWRIALVYFKYYSSDRIGISASSLQRCLLVNVRTHTVRSW